MGGVEPKEMDNWINVEAAAIPSLFPPSFFLFVLCDTCSVEGFGFPRIKVRRESIARRISHTGWFPSVFYCR